MGAWGVLAFDNDDACDWAYELETAGDFSVIEAALNRAEVEHGYLEAPEGSVALAACEVLARLNGGGGVQNSYTEVIDLWVSGHNSKPSALLIERARRAIDRVLGEKSELRDLWNESDSANAWRDAVEDIRSRLGH